MRNEISLRLRIIIWLNKMVNHMIMKEMSKMKIERVKIDADENGCLHIEGKYEKKP